MQNARVSLHRYLAQYMHIGGPMMKFAPIVIVLLTTSAVRAETTFSYTLDTPATTSAGAFKPDGTLVRTLWRKVEKAAGTDTQTWDDKDDDGNTVPPGTYEIRVLRHDVEYVWEGKIGNTSDEQVGNSVHRGFHPISDMACHESTCFFAVGYNEGQECMKKFAIADPQKATPILHADAFTGYTYVATDGTLSYWANLGGFSDDSFVIATRVSDDTLVIFEHGNDVCLNANGDSCWPDQHWPSVLDEWPAGGESTRLSGLAVQRAGGYLFTARAQKNEVHVLDKTTGENVRTVVLEKPRMLTIDSDDNLWMIVEADGVDVVRHYAVAGDGTLSVLATIDGLAAPLDLAVSPDGATLLVADAGEAQQVKAFDTVTRESIFTLGQEGGYATSPDVSHDKFIFDEGTLLAYQPDGSFWVGEAANRRTQHFSASFTYLNAIMYLPHSYSAGVDAQNPKRVYSDFLELGVDYSKPLAGANGSWRLVKNWGARLPAKFTGFGRGIGNTRTLSNGRTYALWPDSTNGYHFTIVELPATGFVRETGIELDWHEGQLSFADNGDLRYTANDGETQRIYVRKLNGFDSSGNPQWDAEVLFGESPIRDGDPVASSLIGPYQTPITTADVAVTFAPHKTPGFHLGGIKKGGTSWLWRASPSGPLDGLGTFDIADDIQYPGNVVLGTGHELIYGYHGEFWQQDQASQWMHFHDDGLFVGQFGRYGDTVANSDGAVAGFAGNSWSPGLVTYNCSTYLWHNDESNHAGVIRWRIDGLDDIRELSGRGELGSAITLDTLSSPPPPCTPAVDTPEDPVDPDDGEPTDGGGEGEEQVDDNGEANGDVSGGCSNAGASGVSTLVAALVWAFWRRRRAID